MICIHTPPPHLIFCWRFVFSLILGHPLSVSMATCGHCSVSIHTCCLSIKSAVTATRDFPASPISDRLSEIRSAPKQTMYGSTAPVYRIETPTLVKPKALDACPVDTATNVGVRQDFRREAVCALEVKCLCVILSDISPFMFMNWYD